MEVKRDPALDRWLGAMSDVGRHVLWPAMEGLRYRMTMTFSDVIGPTSNRTTSDLGLWNGLSSELRPRGRGQAELSFHQSAAHSRRVMFGKEATGILDPAVESWAQRKLGKSRGAARRVAYAVAKRTYFAAFIQKIPFGIGVWDYPLEVLLRSQADLDTAADAIGRIVVEI